MVAFGGGGSHQVAVARFAGAGGEEAFACGPDRLVGVVVVESVLGEAVGGVVDGDDGVGDDPVGVGPCVAVARPAERRPFDEFEGGPQVACLLVSFCPVGFPNVVSEPFEVVSYMGANSCSPPPM